MQYKLQNHKVRCYFSHKKNKYANTTCRHKAILQSYGLMRWHAPIPTQHCALLRISYRNNHNDHRLSAQNNINFCIFWQIHKQLHTSKQSPKLEWLCFLLLYLVDCFITYAPVPKSIILPFVFVHAHFFMLITWRELHIKFTNTQHSSSHTTGIFRKRNICTCHESHIDFFVGNGFKGGVVK